MAAANTDKIRKKKSLFSTTLSAGISAVDTSMTLASASGLASDTAITLTLDRVDANGTSTPSARERVTGTYSGSGSTIANLLRGEDGGSGLVHSSGAVVEDIWEADTWNDFCDAFLVGHNQDGTHDFAVVYDSNGNETVKLVGVASAVNEISITNAATGGNPIVGATGGDTNIGIDLKPKGTGAVRILGTADSAAEVRLLEDTDNGSNYIGLKSPASVGTSKTFTLPDADGSANQVIKTDGSAGLGWATVQPASGWNQYSAVTPTRASADDPTYVLTFAGVDLTGILSVGMKVKLTQSTDKYFFITKIAFSTDTTLTLLGGVDYDVADTAVTAISAFYYSAARAPHGFPLEPSKWMIQTANAGNSTQASPTASQWYNLGSLNIVVPIGAWDAYYFCGGFMDKNVAGNANAAMTLSTANNSESDSNWTTRVQGNSIDTIVSSMHARKYLEVASKTTMYLNGMSDSTAGSDSLGNQKVVIRIVCAYL